MATLEANPPAYDVPEQLTSEEDAAILAKLGYKQELKRSFSMIEVFGIAFSIMGLLPSIAATLSFSVPSGPAGNPPSAWLAAQQDGRNHTAKTQTSTDRRQNSCLGSG